MISVSEHYEALDAAALFLCISLAGHPNPVMHQSAADSCINGFCNDINALALFGRQTRDIVAELQLLAQSLESRVVTAPELVSLVFRSLFKTLNSLPAQ